MDNDFIITSSRSTLLLATILSNFGSTLSSPLHLLSTYHIIITVSPSHSLLIRNFSLMKFEAKIKTVTLDDALLNWI